eukprot:276342-Prymnesium_polylepis.1
MGSGSSELGNLSAVASGGDDESLSVVVDDAEALEQALLAVAGQGDESDDSNLCVLCLENAATHL